MAEKEIRLLRADEIECRVATIKQHGLSLLLYKDARVDQRILDETFGIYGWQRRHECIDGNLYCTVAIKDEKTGEWISKQDVGTSGMAEQEKSQASDSFKRACFNVGIGRELYTAPFIWISSIHAPVKIDKKGDKYICTNKFFVKKITYNDNREIESLKIVNEAGQEVFLWSMKNKYVRTDKDDTEHNTSVNADIYDQNKKAAVAGSEGVENREMKDTNDTDKKLSESQMENLKKEMKRTGVTQKQVKERYEIRDIKVMSQLTYNKVMAALGVTKSKVENTENAA